MSFQLEAKVKAETDETPGPILDLRASLTQFAYPQTSPRRSLRLSAKRNSVLPSRVPVASNTQTLPSDEGDTPGLIHTSTVFCRTPKRPKLRSGYAPPETYAHLDYLPDHLKTELDGGYRVSSSYVRAHRLIIVIFCGIKSVPFESASCTIYVSLMCLKSRTCVCRGWSSFRPSDQSFLEVPIPLWQVHVCCLGRDANF
jgi:hypothetical protein